MTNNNYTPPADLSRLQNIATGVGLIGIIGWVISLIVSGDAKKDAFFHSYLVAFIFWVSVALGCLGLLLVQYLGGATWGLLIRRQLEAGSHTLWLMFVLFLPIATIGLHSIYEWSHPLDSFTGEERRLVEHKSPWLNQTGFLIRGVLYFIVWIGLTAYLRKWSKGQDETGDAGAVQRSQNLAGPGFVLYGLAVTFAAIDWVMSLDVEWFSTIFGLVMLIGMGVLALALIVTVGVYLSGREPMSRVYQPKHFHDLGKLLLAAVMVWAYFSFSQLLIIWSGNLPEEIPWYLERFKGQWRWMGVALILLNFALPFLLLLSRNLKHNRRRLMAVAWLLIAMRFVDLLWLIAPEFESRHAVSGRHYGLPILSYVNYAAAVIGMGGVWLGWFFYQLRQRALIPYKDPQLPEVLARGEHLLSAEGY
ncbi:MAG TPA: hypothetical protein VIM99_02530 [Blastocatellia bacterium]